VDGAVDGHGRTIAEENWFDFIASSPDAPPTFDLTPSRQTERCRHLC